MELNIENANRPQGRTWPSLLNEDYGCCRQQKIFHATTKSGNVIACSKSTVVEENALDSMRLKELWWKVWGFTVLSGGCNTPVASIYDYNKRVPAHNEEVPPFETSSSGLPAAMKTSPNKQSHPISQQNHPKSQSNHSRICCSSICNENDTFKNNVPEEHRNKEARCLTDMNSTQSDCVPHNDRLSQTECVNCEFDQKPKAESGDRTSHNDIATQIDRTPESHHRPPSCKSHSVLKDMGALMEDLCRLLHLKRQTAHPSRLNRLTKSNHNFITSVLLYLLVPAIIISLLASPVSASLSPTTDYVSQNDSGVCSSMDIRNTPKMFEKLKSCRVIEGFLRISLFDHHNESSFVGLTFPELTEITGYLLLYRVNGIKTLGNWFPNLAVIRGNKLLNNFALVIYEVMDLEEIGLYSLTDVTRGAVRIEKNYNLCYVNTIDWGRIVHTGKDFNFFGENKLDNECPMCPQDDGGTTIGATMTRLCPVSSGSENYIKKYHCWNADHCQKICRNDCPGRTCYDNGDCCSEECLGGCHGPKDNCTVCKDLSFGDGAQRKCLSNCPPNTFKHQDRRCITESACRSIERPNEMDKNTTPLYPYKPVKDVCVIECPPKYHEVKNNSVYNCVPCQDACTKECPGSNVDSIQAAQRLRGCTYIKGSLEISVRGGGNIVKELEEGLGLITDIVGSLKVARSYPLISLSFLKSLRRIHGLEGSNKVSNALTVTDNQNLQDLWDFEQHGPIEILNGKLFFHFNPKLCLEKIEPLRSMTKDSNFSDQEVALNSNGDKIACNVTLLNITVDKKTENSVLISWAPYVYEDARSLLGYVVYFTEAPYKNVTLYEGRDACGGDGWHVDDVQDMPGDNNSIYHFIPHLKPYTQYAIYVKTYTIATERVGAQSNIIYMKTLPGEPSPPRIVDVFSPEPNVLTLHWLPPEFPNGNVTQYIVTVQWEEDSESLLKQRNYCVEPLVPQPEKKLPIQPETTVKETTPSYDHNAQCSCDSSGFPKEEEYVNQITFEDYLQNMIYQKKGNVDYNRRRRDVNQMETDEFSLRLPMDQPIQPEFTTNKTNGFYIRYKEIVENQTSLNITSLHHYAAHHITIQACREIDPSELESKDYVVNSNCSHKTTFRQRTARLLDADEITGLTIKIQANNSIGIARIEWIEPKQPNSIILTYHIQYKREDSENAGITPECITRQEYNKTGAYIIKNLNPGNYSIRVMATSLAGNGNYSAYKYFYIEESLSSSGINIIIGCVVGAIGLAVLVGAFFLYRHLQSPAYGVSKLYADVNPEYMSAIYIPDEWEIPRNNIDLVKELGQGSFGMVYEGIARDIPKAGKHGKTNCKPEIRCAVKTVNEHATERERSDFLKEASVMKAFDTFHVVRLMGVVSSGLPTLVIMELMANGDLKSYLRSHRLDQKKPTLSRIMQMAMQIADGMAYLSAKKFVHRDLAARNCMVAGDLTVKVGDFGMTRDIYETDYYRKGSKGLLPVRWMSPESLKDGVFTTSSDAWSYGVVLWEMATLATQPYQGLSNDQVVRYVIDGGVMERPENCPDKLYKLMQLTWQHRPAARPTFLQLVALLINDATTEFKENSFFFSEQGQDILKQTQPSTDVVEETSHSMSPTHHNASSRERGAYLGSDSSPIATPRAHTSPISSYREILKSIVPYSEKTKGEPHEMEALVGIIPTKPITMTKMPMKSSSSPTASTAPNGYLMRPSNNGNPTLLSSSHCETLS